MVKIKRYGMYNKRCAILSVILKNNKITITWETFWSSCQYLKGDISDNMEIKYNIKLQKRNKIHIGPDVVAGCG